jgi:hypothetical protein
VAWQPYLEEVCEDIDKAIRLTVQKNLTVGVGTCHHAILQSKHQLMNDSRYVLCNRSDTPGE